MKNKKEIGKARNEGSNNVGSEKIQMGNRDGLDTGGREEKDTTEDLSYEGMTIIGEEAKQVTDEV